MASVPSSYIPTSGSTATRAAETLSIPAAKLPYPEPVVIGEELIAPIDFTSGWTSAGGNNTSTNANSFTRSGAGGPYKALLETGKYYEISLDVTLTDTTFRLVNTAGEAGLGAEWVFGSALSSGTYNVVWRALDENLYFRLNADGTLAVNSVSIREIQPLAVSIAMEGEASHENGALEYMLEWVESTPNRIYYILDSRTSREGKVQVAQIESGVFDFAETGATYYGFGLNVPFSIASRHGSTFINGAVDGTALTENTTPTALPDLSTTDLDLAPTFMGTIKSFRMWGQDVTDAGIEDASS